MVKGEKVRFDIHNILFSIYKFNNTLESPSIKKIIDNHKKADVSFIFNVTLNSMRFHIHSLKILKKYIKKKLRDHEKILLISAITQIVFLNFKEYAVINCTVEISKKLKLYPALINASLKVIAKNKKQLKNIKVVYNDLPDWFRKRTNSLTIDEKKKFLKNFYKEPDVHIVFKNKEKLNKFDEGLVKTSSLSGFLLNKKEIESKKSFIKGDWWVQDFSSFFPINNIEFKNQDVKLLDACAAPGGKAFQLLSRNLNVTLNDKSKKRIQTLKSNLNRLKFNAKILNRDFIKFDEYKKFDFIIIDAPCSAIGTIRKNPEIFFKSKIPDFDRLNNLQQNMLEKATLLLNSGGSILYMTCSFIKNETYDQINQFLKKNNNFLVTNFILTKEKYNFSKLVKNNLMITVPDKIFDNNIDGYFAAFLKKIK
tara:strand:- start:1544 stop:2812 length:1269 start_codon:yes stop_codon:yes gene_type:complete